jgi:ABC-type dipeptide/oligopeptide/nickel transport system permease subunit
MDVHAVPGFPPESPGRKALRRLVRDPRTSAALTVVLLMLAAALTANVLAPYSYKDQARGSELAGPSGTHWFGTDSLGRDILSRLMFGAQVSMLVAVCATTVSLLIGVNIGLLAGYLGGRAETVLMRFTDMVAAFPSLLLAVAITALCEKPSLQILVFALGVVGWTGIARVVRSQVLTVKELDYVTAARALGVPHARVLFRHVLPNCVSPIIVMATLAVGGNILGEAGLSFLGLGVQEPFPSWGGMLNDARGYFQNFWWVAVFPGLAIVATVLAFNLFGDGLRDALDPRQTR